jgi:C1A family cysteine protease
MAIVGAYKMNYRFQELDERDHTLKVEHDVSNNLELATITKPSTNATNIIAKAVSPSSFTIPSLTNVLNQGQIGDCVANAFAYTVKYQTSNHFSLSRLYLYAICRILDDTSLDQDAGTTVRTACSSIKNYGAVPETLLGYPSLNASATAIERAISTFPSLSILQGAKYFKKFTYTFVNQDITSIKNCLNTYKVPIVFGFLVYTSFLTDSVALTGIVPIPNIKTETLEGGHCMNLVGYNDTTALFTCVNSWGTGWGNKGLCYLPYSYLLDPTLASDFCFTSFIY